MTIINQAAANILQSKKPSRKSKEVTIATGTLRSHIWHDHSARRCEKMKAPAAPRYLECRTLESGRFVERSAISMPLYYTSRTQDSMMCDLLAIMSPAWGEPLGMPEAGK